MFMLMHEFLSISFNHLDSMFFKPIQSGLAVVTHKPVKSILTPLVDYI